MQTVPKAKAIPRTMDALTLLGPNQFEVWEAQVPHPGPREVLCQVDSVAICGTDHEIIQGHFQDRGWPRAYPFTPGHEWSGVVVELGEDAEGFGFQVGDRVAGTSHAGCGYCRMCTIGRYNLCDNYGHEELGHRQYGHYTPGALCQYHNSSIKSVYKIPDTMSLEEGALVDASSIALHGVKRGRVEPGDTVAIIGPGPLGLLTAQCASTMGAGQVIVVGRGERLKTAAALGNQVVNNSQGDGPQGVRELTKGRGADLTVDCAARGSTPRDAVEMTRRGGRVVLTGVPLESVELPLQRLVLEEMDLYGVRGSPNACPEVISLIASGRLNVRAVITHTFPLREFDRAYETFTKRIDGALKVLVKPNPD
ncbi:MAG: zinc-binding dehydrogenase [Dehalococcoidia bacterium]